MMRDILMNQIEKNKILLEKLKMLYPDHIPESDFVKTRRSNPLKSITLKLSMMAAAVLSIILIFKPETAQEGNEIVNLPRTQGIEVVRAETMNPNQLWHTKQLVVSINNGE